MPGKRSRKKKKKLKRTREVLDGDGAGAGAGAITTPRRRQRRGRQRVEEEVDSVATTPPEDSLMPMAVEEVGEQQGAPLTPEQKDRMARNREAALARRREFLEKEKVEKAERERVARIKLFAHNHSMNTKTKKGGGYYKGVDMAYFLSDYDNTKSTTEDRKFRAHWEN